MYSVEKGATWDTAFSSTVLASDGQGLTLVHFSAQLERILWHRGCIQGLSSGCLGGVRGY